VHPRWMRRECAGIRSATYTCHYQYPIVGHSVKPFVYAAAYNASPAHLRQYNKLRHRWHIAAGTIASSPADNRYGRSDVSSSELSRGRCDSSETITTAERGSSLPPPTVRLPTSFARNIEHRQPDICHWCPRKRERLITRVVVVAPLAGHYAVRLAHGASL